MTSTTYRLITADSGDDLARQAAETIASCLDLALAERNRAQIALAGGSTPRACYEKLGAEHLPWDRIDVLLGDERWVAAEHPDSNARMINASLRGQPPGRAACFHPVPTDAASPEDSCRLYGQLLRQLCPGDPPMLDLVLLGLGDDGHTASLFPGTAAASNTTDLVTVGEGKGLARITLTAPVLSAARQVVFLVSGSGKQTALRRLLDPGESAERTPARLVRPQREVLILADRQAAAGLDV
ncbi:MAG: 6-phosphogluconolactonase [Cyanobacteriota bacterium]